MRQIMIVNYCGVSYSFAASSLLSLEDMYLIWQGTFGSFLIGN